MRALARAEPGWFLDDRLAAFARFTALEWPDPSSEEWRYTDLKGFDLNNFAPPTEPLPLADNLDGVPEHVLAAMGDVWERDGLAIQIDGTVVHRRLADPLANKGVIFCDLATAAREHEDLLKDVIGTVGVPASEEKFATLASAFAAGGTFVYVPRGVDVTLPLHAFRWLETPGVLAAARTIIVAEESSSVTYIDHYASPDATTAISIGLVEIHARQAANISYLSVQDHGPDMYHFNIQRGEVRRDATLRSLAATLGGKVSRSVVESMLVEQGASAEMLGVYFADGDQHFDHRSLQEHSAPNTTSELLYKGALKGESRAVYSGLIHIAKDAQKADAVQTNRNLILSDHAKADSIPYLEIEANDVRCAHGASVGPVDDNQLFYLQSRGLDADEAEDLIVRGYFQEILDRVRVPEVRAALERAVEAELKA
ncbi:MAG: Fe-S cluster assembly protein SufD [Actinomycetota bacterium]